MKPIKVSEASGAVLNWMVATALGRGPQKDMYAFGGVWRGWWLRHGGTSATNAVLNG